MTIKPTWIIPIIISSRISVKWWTQPSQTVKTLTNSPPAAAAKIILQLQIWSSWQLRQIFANQCRIWMTQWRVRAGSSVSNKRIHNDEFKELQPRRIMPLCPSTLCSLIMVHVHCPLCPSTIMHISPLTFILTYACQLVCFVNFKAFDLLMPWSVKTILFWLHPHQQLQHLSYMSSVWHKFKELATSSTGVPSKLEICEIQLTLQLHAQYTGGMQALGTVDF